MVYHVTIGGRTLQVELADGSVRVDGEQVEDVELLPLAGTGVHHLRAAGDAHAILARHARSGEWDLHMNGRRMSVEVVDERTRAIRAMTRASAGPTGPRPVRAPMPGLVVRVEVEEGSHVTAGQGVLIMEAMKMENELRADAAGRVARVLVQPGQAVEKGTVLIEFEALDG